MLKGSKNYEIWCAQGSVLGPLLFVLNELFSIEAEGHIAFADDTVIFYKSNNWNELKHKVQNDLIRKTDAKLLTVNFNKTYFVPFCYYDNALPKYDTVRVELSSGNVAITKTMEQNYLGI